MAVNPVARRGKILPCGLINLINIPNNRQSIKTLIDELIKRINDSGSVNYENFKNLTGYEKRLYGYIGERYLSYWFNKYTNPIEWDWVFVDMNKGKRTNI